MQASAVQGLEMINESKLSNAVQLGPELNQSIQIIENNTSTRNHEIIKSSQGSRQQSQAQVPASNYDVLLAQQQS